ncbi:MAG: hypothetical protein ACHQX4_05635 [Gemmatimonadales bacterium]
MRVRRLWLLSFALVAIAPRARAQDADTIIARVIARRQEVLARAQHARYDVEVKFVARDAGLSPDSATSILLISETRSSAYWEASGAYLETVLARRRSGSQGGAHGLASIAEIANVGRDRIELEEFSGAARSSQASGRSGGGRNRAGPGRYAIVSPVAPDARRFYGYSVLDTVTVAGRRAYRLSIEPRSNAPLLTGTIDVADSTWDLLAIDAVVGDSTPFGGDLNLRYEERDADAGQGTWLPALIRLTGEVRPRVSSERVPRQVAGIRLPGVPRHLLFEHVAVLDSFRFDEPRRPPDVGEYRVVVVEGADRPNSEAWVSGALPLSAAERSAMARADSAEQHPGTIARFAMGIGAAAQLAGDPGFFHYNRVDGAYVGAAREWRAGPGVLVTTRLGYGLGSEVWQYRLGAQARVSESQRLWVGAWYHDETLTWPTLVSFGYNPTYRAFFARMDPHDYYRERGVELVASGRLLDRTRLELRYVDAYQSTLDTVQSLSFTRGGRGGPLPNPPIVDGRMRSVTATLSWDSRAMMRSAGRDFRLGGQNWTRVALTAEAADPSVIPDDFSYRRYTAQVEHQQEWVPGTTTIALAAGAATGDVPPQRYFTVDFGMGILAADGIGFSTLYRTNYSGNRAAMIAVRHDFGRRLLAGSGLPLLRSLPFTVSLHAGAFWTGFVDHTALGTDSLLSTTPTPYRELGFSLGNLTPFLSPINLAASFAWQLSSYPTRSFRFGFDLTGP